KDPTHTEAEALEQIYALLRPGEAPNLETARQALERLFFHPKRYDLGRVGRYKINQRLKLNVAKDHTVLTEDDFIAIIRYLIELRDVHYSQYGRMCPIETPEGPNIGLITSLSTYARVNDLGFIETPYREVKNGKVTDEIRWLSASEEEEYAVAQANARVTEDGHFTDELVLCRKRDDYPLLAPGRIDFMDVAPEQLVSIAAALIPF